MTVYSKQLQDREARNLELYIVTLALVEYCVHI